MFWKSLGRRIYILIPQKQGFNKACGALPVTVPTPKPLAPQPPSAKAQPALPATTFTHIQSRPLPSIPEGWSGPMAVATLYYWTGYDQQTLPLDQLKTVHHEAINAPNRAIHARDAKLVMLNPLMASGTHTIPISLGILTGVGLGNSMGPAYNFRGSHVLGGP